MMGFVARQVRTKGQFSHNWNGFLAELSLRSLTSPQLRIIINRLHAFPQSHSLHSHKLTHYTHHSHKLTLRTLNNHTNTKNSHKLWTITQTLNTHTNTWQSHNCLIITQTLTADPNSLTGNWHKLTHCPLPTHTNWCEVCRTSQNLASNFVTHQ